MEARFGMPIGGMLDRWFNGEFREDLEEKYGDKASTIAVVILRPVALYHIQPSAAAYTLCILSYGDDVRIKELLSNIYGKFNFTLRTGLPSSKACQRPDLVEPGDFPHAGAQIHRNYPVSVSALHEESDDWVGQRVVDNLIQLRHIAGDRAIDASKRGDEGWKFLGGEGAPDGASRRMWSDGMPRG